MAAKSWTEVREINGKTYLIQHYEVDTHEGAVIRSNHIVREANSEDVERKNRGAD